MWKLRRLTCGLNLSYGNISEVRHWTILCKSFWSYPTVYEILTKVRNLYPILKFSFSTILLLWFQIKILNSKTQIEKPPIIFINLLVSFTCSPLFEPSSNVYHMSMTAMCELLVGILCQHFDSLFLPFHMSLIIDGFPMTLYSIDLKQWQWKALKRKLPISANFRYQKLQTKNCILCNLNFFNSK